MTDEDTPDVPQEAPQAMPNETTAESASPTHTPRPFRIRRVIVGAIVAAIIMVTVQWFAPSFDHQNANFVCLLTGILFLFFVTYETHRTVKASGHAWRVPMAAVAAWVAFFVCFRVDGFSGEMLPNLKLRFATEDRLEWKESVADETAPAPAASEADSTAIAQADSLQFLGPNRTGVITDRMFDVPKDDASVKVLWNQGIGEGWSSFAVAGDRAVTLEQREDQECVTCYRLSDGELLWIQKHEARHEHALGGIGPRTTPTIVGDRVYANGATGFFRCIDLATGEIVWTKDLQQLAGWEKVAAESAVTWGNSTSPLVLTTPGICVVGIGGPVDPADVDDEGMTDTPKSLVALDMKTGDVRWKAGRDQMSYASPMLMKLHGQEQIVSVNEKTISGHVVANGEVLWQFPWPGASNANANCAAAMPAGKNRILVGKGYGGGSALIEVPSGGLAEAEEVWLSSRTLRTKFNHACVDGDVAYALDNGSLQAARVSTGESLWVQPRRSRFGQGQVVLVDDVLVAQSEPGDVVFVAADASEYQELGRLDALNSKTWNIPTVAGRHLLVRNDRQVICYLLPEKSE